MLQIIIKSFLCLLATLFVCCKNSEDFVREGRDSISVVKKFDDLFDEKEHSVARHSGSPGPLIWLSEANVYDRYTIQMSFLYKEVKSDGELTNQANFEILIYETYLDLDGDRVKKTVGGMNLNQWKKIHSVKELLREGIEHTRNTQP